MKEIETTNCSKETNRSTSYNKLVTKGMKRDCKTGSIATVPDAGLIVWDNIIETLINASQEVNNGSIILNKSTLDKLPISGLISILGDKWYQILERSGVLNETVTGYFAINSELESLATWIDRPDSERASIH